MAQSWRAASVRSGPAPAGGEGIAASRDPRTARSEWSNYCHEICTRHKLINYPWGDESDDAGCLP